MNRLKKLSIIKHILEDELGMDVNWYCLVRYQSIMVDNVIILILITGSRYIMDILRDANIYFMNFIMYD